MNQNRWMKKQSNRNMSRSKEKVIQNIVTESNGKMAKWFVGLFCLALTFLLFAPVTARADMGPKPSVRILFENMGGELCYGTLLSERQSTGPASVWDGNEEDARHNGNYEWCALDYETWKAFVEYEDPDGYYFLQEGWDVGETKEIAWTYYPPNRFKILLYYPETGTFVSSGIYEKYAFDTYYTVDMNGVDMGSVEYNEELSTDQRMEEFGSVEYDEELSTNERIEAYRSYNYRVEVISMIVRILATIAVEMILALLFGFRKKKQLLLLIGVNTATQVILNVLLNVINYSSGHWAFVFFYVLFELLVFGVEAIVYCMWMNRLSEKTKPTWFYVLYAFVANGVSFVAGIYIANLLPGIF